MSQNLCLAENSEILIFAIYSELECKLFQTKNASVGLAEDKNFDLKENLSKFKGNK